MKSFARIVILVALFCTFSLIQVRNRINDETRNYLRSLLLLQDSNGDFFEFKRMSIKSSNLKTIYPVDERLLAKEPEMDWANVVFIVPVHDEQNIQKIIQAQFDTLLKRVGFDADIVFIADNDDNRKDKEILPDTSLTKANIHLYRSGAKKEGSKARAKVIDSLNVVYEKFKNNENKKFFIKLDPDSYVVPHSLMNYLKELRKKTHDKPVDFGYGLCHTSTYCYTEGGLYGMNKAGLSSVINYLKEKPEVMNDHVSADPKLITYATSDNYLEHEDAFTSYVFFKATGLPVISSNEISMDFVDRDAGTYPISIHPVKHFRDHYVLDKIFYNDKNERRGENYAMKNLDLLKPILNIEGYGRFAHDHETGRGRGFFNKMRKRLAGRHGGYRKHGYGGGYGHKKGHGNQGRKSKPETIIS